MAANFLLKSGDCYLMKEAIHETSWESSNIQVFWGEIAPCDHLVQIYESENIFMNTLEGFVGDGFIRKEAVIVIATPSHIVNLNNRLKNQGFDLDMLMAKDQYIPVDANESIEKFMVNGWPDEILFSDFVGSLLKRARLNNRKVRAFGEMVALLWAQGHNGATVRLETLWHQLQLKNKFCIYCAYPKSGFTQDANASIDKICETHSKLIDGCSHPSTEIYYKATA